jgi:hypothetical protein
MSDMKPLLVIGGIAALAYLAFRSEAAAKKNAETNVPVPIPVPPVTPIGMPTPPYVANCDAAFMAMPKAYQELYLSAAAKSPEDAIFVAQMLRTAGYHDAANCLDPIPKQ